MASSSSSSSSSTLSVLEQNRGFSAESQEKVTSVPKPVEYFKVTAEEGDDQHIFIIDKDAAMRFSSTISDLMGIQDAMQGHLLVDDPPCCSSSSSQQSSLIKNTDVVEFREIPTRALETCIKFFYWKKRWAHVVL